MQLKVEALASLATTIWATYITCVTASHPFWLSDNSYIVRELYDKYNDRACENRASHMQWASHPNLPGYKLNAFSSNRLLYFLLPPKPLFPVKAVILETNKCRTFKKQTVWRSFKNPRIFCSLAGTDPDRFTQVHVNPSTFQPKLLWKPTYSRLRLIPMHCCAAASAGKLQVLVFYTMYGGESPPCSSSSSSSICKVRRPGARLNMQAECWSLVHIYTAETSDQHKICLPGISVWVIAHDITVI